MNDRTIKVLHFLDPFNFDEDVELWNKIINKHFPCSFYKAVNEPTFLREDKGKYDILLFDWGGMSVGNSLMDYFCRYIIKEAECYPNKYYVMVSSFTASAMKDAEGVANSKLHNIYVDFDKFIEEKKQFLVNK